MEGFKTHRDALRNVINRKMRLIKTELGKEVPDKTLIEVHQKTLETMFDEMQEVEVKVLEVMLRENCSIEDYEAERESIDNLNVEWVSIGLSVDNLVRKFETPPASQYDTASQGSSASIMRHRFKLPKIEMKKFNGELMEWLGWWSQFSKIHDDDSMHTTDKFQYLLQAITAGTRAMDLVTSYPMTEENYPKVIRALKQRFAKKKILKQVYVRELLKMVMNNTKTGQEIKLSKMYDSLESHLRSLEALGVTSEQTAEFLYPRVESSLPEEVLIAWQRSSSYGIDGSKMDPPTTEMDHLMRFLQKEIEIEGQRQLVRAGFQFEETKEKKSNQTRNTNRNREECATAAGLFSSTNIESCVFCTKNHPSADCFKAQRMTLKEKNGKVQEMKACYTCLRRGHFTKNCKVKVQCIICNSRKHMGIMCTEKSQPNDSHGELKTNTSTAINQGYNQCSGDVLLQTLLVRIQGPDNKERVARVIFDSGSQGTSVRTETVDDLKLKPFEKVSLRTVLYGGQVTELRTRSKFKLHLKSMNGRIERDIIALDEPVICGRISRIPEGPWLQELAKKQIWLNDFVSENPEIEILIGSDNYGQLMTGRMEQLECGLTAFQTVFGWTMSGRVPKGQDSVGMMSLCTSLMNCQFSISDLWSLETLGIKDPAEVKSKQEREEATSKHFQETVSRDQEGRYSVRLPWIEESPCIPDNKRVAEKRLQSATSKLLSANKYDEYDKIFNQWLEEGIIENVSENCQIGGREAHYLPHRPVFKPTSLTTPVRPVFDASCKVGRSPSLNQCLEKGPNLLELIPSILLRFREKLIGSVSDIRKAFLMIDVDEVDRDYLRFLWWESPERKSMKIFRHKRVVFGLNCSPFLLGAVLELHLKGTKKSQQSIADKLLKSLYVDNSITSVDSLDEYEKFKAVAIELLSSAKMDLRQWECSSVKGSGISSQDSGCGLELLGECNSQKFISVLGYKWDAVEDTLAVEIPQDNLPEQITKRVILSLVQKVFDPMGFLSPTTLVPKMLLQKTWASKASWDEDLDEDVKKEFTDWWSEVPVLEMVKIPRHAFLLRVNSVQFHTFSDACRYAYAALVFVRVDDGNEVKTQLLQAKSRVAPLNPSTIPRLELLGCTLASRLTHSVKEALSMNEVSTFFWTDSTTALAWIQRNDEWGTFVGNRVKEICKLTNSTDWSFVPGNMNPADLPSRGCSPSILLNSHWWEGPEWLKRAKEEWPIHKPDIDESLVEEEKKKGMTHKLTSSEAIEPWYLKRYSTLNQNLRLLAYVLRFVNKCRKKDTPIGDLSIAEIDETEKVMIKLVQGESFELIKHGNVISGLRVEVDTDGIIRVKTKLLNIKDFGLFSLPYLLPSFHPMVDLLVKEYHVLSGHAGVQFLIGNLRERYWIVKSRQSIKKVISSCVTCRRYATKKSTVPQAPLPEDRVKMGKVFQVTGVDLAGPLYLKDGSKTWIVLFTCAVYRCVHLELVDSLSTDAFLLAFHRFVSRRGRPNTVYSDNGTNFTGASNLFKELDWKKIVAQTGVQRIQWKFNPPSAAWWGGWWERLIRILKDILKRMLGKRKLNFCQLYTCLCQAEAVMNDRPLTYVSEDQEDLIPLKPSMFLKDIQVYDFPECENVDSSLYPETYQSLTKLKDELRNRFKKEYLSELVQRGKSTIDYPFKKGDIVLIGDDNKKRMDWPMGRIMELYPGIDDKHRVAKVKTSATGSLVRVLQRLYPLEVTRPFEELPIIERKKKDLAKKKKADQILEPDDPETVPDTGENVREVRTRYGRLVKKPSRS